MKARPEDTSRSNVLRRARQASPPQCALGISYLGGYDVWTGDGSGDWIDDDADDGTDDRTHDTVRLDELDLRPPPPAKASIPPGSCREQIMALVGAITQDNVGVVLTSGGARLVMPSDLLFDPSHSRLTRSGGAAIASLANTLLPYPALRVQVEGHTDSLPEVQATRLRWLIGFERAIAVRERLVREGVRRSSVQGLTFAGTRPIASNASEAGRARNRRIELLILGTT